MKEINLQRNTMFTNMRTKYINNMIVILNNDKCENAKSV